MTTRRASFGSTRKMASGRYQASVKDPDRPGKRIFAPGTFRTKAEAEAWIRKADQPDQEPRRAPAPTMEAYWPTWLSQRDLRPRTAGHYTALYHRFIEPTFSAVRLDAITPTDVRTWHSGLATGPTYRAHAYSLLRTILGTAVTDDLLASNPCKIRGAGTTSRKHKVTTASLEELDALVEAMPAHLRLAVLLAAWGALRWGEIAELRVGDIDRKDLVVHVRRAVTRVEGGYQVGPPKTEAGVRDVHLPPHLRTAVEEHLTLVELKTHKRPVGDPLLFPSEGGQHMAPSVLYASFYPARESIGRGDLRFHDLRHTGAVLAAQSGATLADLMGRLGHTTPGAAMIYQHTVSERDALLAQRLSEAAGKG